MFKQKGVDSYLKGIKTIQSGKFLTEQGQEVPFDGYTQVILTFKATDGTMRDLKCRIPNTGEGRALEQRLLKVDFMTKLLVDLDIDVSSSGSSKIFLTDFLDPNSKELN